MNPKQILVALLTYAAVLSGLLTYLELKGIAEPDWLGVGATLVPSLLIFWWYWSDSKERAYPRSPLLNVAVVAISFVAIPYYLARSRAKGERIRTFAGLVGFIALMLLALVVGGVSGAVFG